MRLCRSQPFRDTEFYTHDYLLLSPYIFYMPPYKLFSSMITFFYMPPYKLFSSMIKEYDQIFLHRRIFYRYNFTHASPILCSKSLHLHLYFLGLHLYIYKWLFIFYSQAYQIDKYNIIFTSINCATEHEAITLSYFTLHF